MFLIDVSMKCGLEMIIFEEWMGKPFSKVYNKADSVINLAELYWQGLDPDFDLS